MKVVQKNLSFKVVDFYNGHVYRLTDPDSLNLDYKGQLFLKVEGFSDLVNLVSGKFHEIGKDELTDVTDQCELVYDQQKKEAE